MSHLLYTAMLHVARESDRRALRLRMAESVLRELIRAYPNVNLTLHDWEIGEMASKAVRFADAMINELEKAKGDGQNGDR